MEAAAILVHVFCHVMHDFVGEQLTDVCAFLLLFVDCIIIH